MDEVAEEYRSSLAELNFNSKPHINMLTMLAEENIKHAPSIVQTIVEYIKSVSSDMMLPCLYLVDSIIKNIGKIYIQLFSKHLVAMFTSVFEKVDETVRSALYKLRSTWTNIFPNALLLRLDKGVVLLDPAWPILAQPPQPMKIHVNPKFLDKTAATQLPEKEEAPPTSQNTLLQEANAIKKKQLEVLQVLQAKKKQLMELKKKAQASGVVEYLGSDVQKVLNARDPRLSKKSPGVDASVLQSVVVVPKVPRPSGKKDDPAAQNVKEKRSVSPEPKKLKMEDSNSMVLKEDLRNKLNDIKNSTAIVEKNLNDKIIVVGNKNKRKHSVSSDSPIVPASIINNKIKVPLTESATLQSKSNNPDMSNQSINHIVTNTKILPSNIKQNEDLYSKDHRIQPTATPGLFGNEDKDYRTLMLPKPDSNERILKEPAFPKRVPIPVVKSFKLDNKERKVYFVNDKCFVVMEDNIPRELSFEGPPKLIFVEGLSKPFELGFGGHEVKFEIDGKWNSIKFGTPAREVYINNYPCEAQFGGQPLAVVLENGKLHRIHISGPPPNVVLGEKPAYQLYEKFCQSHQEFLSRYNSHSEMTPEIQSASRDVDMRVISNKFQPTIFNFPLEKVNDVDWQRMVVEDSTQTVWNAPKNAFETFKDSNSGFVPLKNYPDAVPDWSRNMPVTDVKNQMPPPLPPPMPLPLPPPMPPALPPPVPPKELLDRFPLVPHTTVTSDLPTSVPGSNALSFPPLNYSVPPLNPQINKVQLTNTPRLSPPPLPPFLPPVSSSTCITAPYINTTVATAPVPMTSMPPPIHTTNIQAPVSRPCLLPTPLPVNTVPNSMSIQNMPNPLQMTNPVHMTGLPNAVQVTSSVTAPAIPKTTSTSVNMDMFLKKLIDAGIIGKKSGTSTPPPGETEKEEDKREWKKIEPIPKIRLVPKSLKEYHPGVVSMLHCGSQCATCGMRFKEIQSEQYSRHLDWHFRMNRREKDGAKKPFSRRLFYEIKDWIQFKEFEEKDERAPSYFELQAGGEQPGEDKPETLCSVPSSECESENCAVCGEQFQLFWVEDEEEWHLRNAVKHDDQVYHPACYEDFKKVCATPEIFKKSNTKNIFANESINQDPDTSVEEGTGAIKDEKTDEEHEKMDEDPEKSVSETEEKVVIKEKPEDVKPVMAEEESDVIKIKEESMEIEEAPTENKTTEDAVDIKMEIVVAEKVEESKQETVEESKQETVEESKQETVEESKLQKDEESKLQKDEESKLEKSVDDKAEESKPAETEDSKEESKPSEIVPVKTGGEEEEEDVGFRPPTPDPRFEVLPPVLKGTELSALCTIM